MPGRPGEQIDYTLSIPTGKDDPETLVVYCHGFASHQKGEKALFFRDRFLDAGAAFLAFDHRGHGDSSGVMSELSISRNLEDLDAILAATGRAFKRRILAGSSMGGQTAAWYAARHPREIAANLLIAPGFRFLENRIRDLGPEGLEKLDREGKAMFRNEWVEVTIGRDLIEDGRKYPMEKLIPDYKTPTLILHGTADATVPFEDSVTFVEKTTARPLELVLIAGGDHRLTANKEDLFDSMASFCRRFRLL